MPDARGASSPRTRLLTSVLLTVAILALPTAVYALGRNSSSFDIAHISVAGTGVLPEKKVLRLLRGAYQGANLFSVSAADVQKTLAPLQCVAAVTVDRDFPDTLRVQVTEYTPSVYALAGGRWYVVAASGHVIAEQVPKAKADTPASSSTASVTPAPLVTATGAVDASGAATTATAAAATAAATPDAGATAAAKDAAVQAKLESGPAGAPLTLPRAPVAGKLRPGGAATDPALPGMLAVVSGLPASLRTRLAVIRALDGQLTLWFAGGPVASWGTADRTLAKTIALRAVLQRYDEAGKTCTSIDVSIPDRVLAKPMLGNATAADAALQ